MSNVYFPKKSHHGYFDKQLQRHFYDKKEKRDFMNKYGFVEGDYVSKAHQKRLKDFIHYQQEMKVKDPKNETRWKQTLYPD